MRHFEKFPDHEQSRHGTQDHCRDKMDATKAQREKETYETQNWATERELHIRLRRL